MNLGLIIKAAFKNIDNTETYDVAKGFLLNLVESKVPSKITGLYVFFIKAYEVLKFSCKQLAERVKASPNTLDNYCLTQGLKAVLAITKKVQEDANAMANLAGISLT